MHYPSSFCYADEHVRLVVRVVARWTVYLPRGAVKLGELSIWRRSPVSSKLQSSGLRYVKRLRFSTNDLVIQLYNLLRINLL